MHKKINDQLLSQGINRGFLSAAALGGLPLQTLDLTVVLLPLGHLLVLTA